MMKGHNKNHLHLKMSVIFNNITPVAQDMGGERGKGKGERGKTEILNHCHGNTLWVKKFKCKQ